MQSINMALVNQVKEIKEKTGISTKSALEIMVDTEVCKAEELPDAETMDAILRGLNQKHSTEAVHV